MPVYAYECEKCGYEFEVEQSINDKPRSRCPECRGKVNKVFHSVGIVFKGSGFYCTDSRSGSRTKPAACGNGANGNGACGTGSCPAHSTAKDAAPPCSSCKE